MSEYKRLRVAGHKLTRENNNYPDGWCECGQWKFKGWTNRMTDVIRQHNSHVAQTKQQKVAA